MKINKKIKVLKVYEKESLLGGFKNSLNLNLRVSDCDDDDPTSCCNNYQAPVAPSQPYQAIPVDRL